MNNTNSTLDIKKNDNISDKLTDDLIDFLDFDDGDNSILNKDIEDLIDSLNFNDDIVTKKIKSIDDIKKECDKNKQHFHITQQEFDDIYNPQYADWTDNYNTVCDNLNIVKRMLKRKMFVDIQKRLRGSIRARYINTFKLDNPEIELCDIVNFINNELKPIRSKFKNAVYIDICQDSKFYVGISSSRYLDNNIEPTDENMAKNRLESHRDNGGGIFPTNFTYMYPVISCLCYFYGNKEDEDLITILMSKCVGNNVRGGIYACPFTLPKYPDYTIDEIKNKLLNRIL